MDTLTRYETYTRNRNGGTLTARQSRRLVSKALKSGYRPKGEEWYAASPKERALALIAEFLEKESRTARRSTRSMANKAPEDGACPKCGAVGDEPCRTASGAKARKPHAGRPQG